MIHVKKNALIRSILAKNGSVVDSAIATLFCEGVAMPQSTGLGGGFFMVIYIKETQEIMALNAREVAPLQAHEDLFQGNASLAQKGGLAVAVPGELRGYEAAWQKYGRLPWAELVQPTIDLCLTGHLVTPFFAKFLKSQEAKIMASPTLKEIYVDPETNEVYKEGERIKRPTLARTLQTIALEGANALYDGSLSRNFVEDIQNAGGIMTEQDLKLYQPQWLKPTESKLPDDLTLYSHPLPGSGVILTFIMNILSGFLDGTSPESALNYQRMIESFKYGYGKRTELGDVDFVVGIQELLANLTSPDYADGIRSLITDDRTFQDPRHYGANFSLGDDYGTAHISILAPNGDAVSATGTINL